MKQAGPKPTAARKRPPKQFEPHVPHDWQYKGKRPNSILTTVRRSADALVKIEERHPEWHGTLAVAQILLCRLEEMRLEARHRSGMAAAALSAGDAARAADELEALAEVLATASRFETPALHGVCVSKDRCRHGIGVELERVKRSSSE